jgi:hypothetical protein
MSGSLSQLYMDRVVIGQESQSLILFRIGPRYLMCGLQVVHLVASTVLAI